jgi:two-component system, OmpR family, sensor kinase
VSSPSADRLRRLRWLLTLLFTAMNTVGLVVLAWLVIKADSDERRQRLDGELRRVTTAIPRLLAYEGDTIVTAFINEDPLNNQCPRFAVLPGGAEQFRGHLSSGDCGPTDNALFSRLAAQAVRTGAELSGYERGSDGRLVYVAAEPLLNKAGERIGAVVAVGDAEGEQAQHLRMALLVIGGCAALIAVLGLGGYVLAGRAIRPAAAALEQQEVLLGETAHDLRTPVAALRALAETAQRNPDQQAELLPRTVSLAAEMGGIIDALLVRARLAAGVEQVAIQPVWLDQLVAGVVEETPKEDARVTVTAAQTKVDADPALLRRAIRNLLDNALRHGRQPGAQAIVHITVVDGRVIVADHGPGIDAAVAETVFDRFSSGGGSSGLGLSIVRWVALVHGGSLGVYNADDGGAIFELALPVSAP